MTTTETQAPRDAGREAFLGALVADAVAMPVHWYYDRQALDRDYPELAAAAEPMYLAPRSPHADSILWRSSWTPPGPKFDILREQAAFWGKRGIHYHQFLAAGENTLNFRLAVELFDLVRTDRDYDPERWLDRYVAFMLEPGRHRDTYVEEYHRYFFTNLGAGRKPINCGVRDIHIGGLAQVPALVAALGPRHPDLRRSVRVHVGLTHKDDEVLAAADALVQMLGAVIPRSDAPPPPAASAAEGLRSAILEHGRDWISAAKLRSWQDLGDRQLVGSTLSSACYIEDAFPAALALAWRHAGDFAGGVRSNALCGGDNCHRGAVVGSLLGAASSIPHHLLAGLQAGGRVTQA